MTRQQAKALRATWDRQLAALGFESCDELRWIRTTVPGAKLFGTTVWISALDETAPTGALRFEAAIGVDTEFSPDLAAYEPLNCEFASPVEAAEFALDELREGLRDALATL